MPTIEFIKEAINQDKTLENGEKERVSAGDVREVSDFEAGRHLAEGSGKIFEAPDREAKVETMARRRGRKPRNRGSQDI